MLTRANIFEKLPILIFYVSRGGDKITWHFLIDRTKVNFLTIRSGSKFLANNLF
jgi:hypothetical protein